MAITFSTAPAVPVDDDGLLVLGVRSDRLDEDLAGLDRELLDAAGFDGQTGQRRFVTDGSGALRLLAGLGPADGVGPAVLRRAAAGVSRSARKQPALTLDLLRCAADGTDVPAAAQGLAEGTMAGAYRFDVHRSLPTVPNLIERVGIIGKGGKRLQGAVARGVAIGDAVALARDLVNEPGGTLTPPVFAERATEAAAAAGLSIRVFDEAAIRAAGMGGLLGVNRGSHQPPRFLEVAWEPERPRGFVALVGKGITFDAGGLSIKTAEGMSTMKDDMGGAAAVLATLTAVPTIAPRLRVAAYIPITDNMLGPDAMRVGDVLTIRNGLTVEVLNTDAEGRLVLADALVKASEDGPDAIIDLATLTGACEVALGSRTAGLMGTHPGLRDMVVAAAEATGEDVWPLPMPDHLRRQLESDVADLRNIGTGRSGGALIAAHFLSRFVGEGIPWAHLDIAGPAWSRDDDVELSKGGTGFGVRLLLELLARWKRPI